MAATFTAAFLGVAVAPYLTAAGLFNGAASGVVIKVKRVYAHNYQLSAVAGTLTQFELRRSTYQAGGVSVSPVPHDTASPALPSEVLVAVGPTVASSPADKLGRFVWSLDEPTATSGALDEIQCFFPLCPVWDATRRRGRKPIVLREDEGLDIRHIGNTSTGRVDLYIEFVVE